MKFVVHIMEVMWMFTNRTVKTSYYYDVNSLYPAAMLNPIPVGNGVLTHEKDVE